MLVSQDADVTNMKWQLSARYIIISLIVLACLPGSCVARQCNQQERFTAVQHRDINRTASDFDVLRVEYIASKDECIKKCYGVESCLASSWKAANNVYDKILSGSSSGEVEDSLVPADGWTIFIKEILQIKESQGTFVPKA